MEFWRPLRLLLTLSMSAKTVAVAQAKRRCQSAAGAAVAHVPVVADFEQLVERQVDEAVASLVPPPEAERQDWVYWVEMCRSSGRPCQGLVFAAAAAVAAVGVLAVAERPAAVIAAARSTV